MNKKYYSFGNPFKVKFRDHFCYRCGNRLTIIKDSKKIDKSDENAKYYDFSINVDGGTMIGSCEFIHNLFFCSECSKKIEFVTQISLEDIDKIINKVENYYSKKRIKINITKRFMNSEGLIIDDCYSQKISYLSLAIEEADNLIETYELPIKRKNCWERPYYYKLRRNDLIEIINQKRKLAKPANDSLA